MQFKHPEILYALFALLIPILIHLFQLQRFTKTPFTNVKILKKIELQTRKSSRLKQYLVLFSRLGLFAAIIIAFAQPYFSDNTTSKEWITTIYLDNSMSMQARGERGKLLERAIQDIINHIPEKGVFSLITNDQIYTDLPKTAFVEQLKNTEYSASQATLASVFLKADKVFKKYPDQHHRFLLFSDFQETLKNETSADLKKNTLFQTFSHRSFDYVQLFPQKKYNLSIDSIFVSDIDTDIKTLEVIVRNQGEKVKNVNISVLQNQMVLAKNTLSIDENEQRSFQFHLPDEMTNLSIKTDYEDAYKFDNTHYLSFAQREKISVLLVTNGSSSFLEKIYTPHEFHLTKNTSKQLAYERIEKQNLIVLDGLQKISQNLQNKLVEFVHKGGSLSIIPNKNDRIETLNAFLNQLGVGQLTAKRSGTLKITKIHFSHPLLKNVFDKRVDNFQYPIVNTYFNGIFPKGQPLLSFEDQRTFVNQIGSKRGKVFWVAAPLDNNSSNFTNAPLVVPVFYKIGSQSSKQAELSYYIGLENQIVIHTPLQKDEALHLTNATVDFIPRQQVQSEKVFLTTDALPKEAGFYKVKNNDKFVQNLAYNNNKRESKLSFLNMEVLAKTNKNIRSFSSIQQALATLATEQSVQSYFKYFVLLALLFLLIEILLLKYL